MKKNFSNFILALFIFSLTLMVYTQTLLPTVGFSDIGELQTVAVTLGIAHPPGYPLYTLVGKLFTLIPARSLAWRVNFMSAFFASTAAVLVYLIIRKITNQYLGGLFAAFSLAFSKNFWQWALVAEMYTLNVFLIAFLFYFLLIWEEQRPTKTIYLFSFLYGLSWGNHPGIIVLAPAFGLFIFLNQPKIIINLRTCFVMLILFILGLSIYFYLPIRASMNPPLNYAHPTNFKNFTYLVLAKQFRAQTFSAPWAEFELRLKDLFQSFFKEFSLFCLLPLLGLIYALRQKGLAIFLVGVFSITAFVWLKYNVSDYDRYLTPVFFAFFCLAGLGISFLEKMIGRGARRISPPLAKGGRYLSLFLLIILSSLLPLKLYQGNYQLVDQSKNFGAYQWGIETLKKIEPGGVVLSWWPYSTVLWYLKYAEHLAEDITIIDDRNIIDENLGGHEGVMKMYVGRRPFYILPEGGRVEKAKKYYKVTPIDHLVKVEPKE